MEKDETICVFLIFFWVAQNHPRPPVSLLKMSNKLDNFEGPHFKIPFAEL
jgi:hypothetical protein